MLLLLKDIKTIFGYEKIYRYYAGAAPGSPGIYSGTQ